MLSNEDSPFDTVIIDEAAKANLSETLAPISIGKKVILVGDHQQLPPYVAHDMLIDFKTENPSPVLFTNDQSNLVFEEYKIDDNYKAIVTDKTQSGIFCKLGEYSGLIPKSFLSNNANTPIALQKNQDIGVTIKEVDEKEKRFVLDLNEDPIEKAVTTSLFEFLQEMLPSSHKILLNIQHRMHPVIGKFISDTFYDSDIKNGKGTIQKILNIRSPFDKPLLFWDTSRDKNSGEKILDNGGILNALEAHLITKKILPQLLKEETILKKDIAIVTPYKEQYKLIRSKLNNSDLSDIEVATLDSFQGREVKIMIFSFTRSRKGGTVGFLDDAQRLNVALSRPQSMLVLIGNSFTLTNWRSHKNEYYADLFNKLFLHVKRDGKVLRDTNIAKVKYYPGNKFDGIVINIIDFDKGGHGIILKEINGQIGMIFCYPNFQLPKINDKIEAWVISPKKPGRIDLSMNKPKSTGNSKKRTRKNNRIQGEVIKYTIDGLQVRINENETGNIEDP